MIDVKELRIGNLVLYKNKICMVNMVDIGDMVGVSIIENDTVKIYCRYRRRLPKG